MLVTVFLKSSQCEFVNGLQVYTVKLCISEELTRIYLKFTLVGTFLKGIEVGFLLEHVTHQNKTSW